MTRNHMRHLTIILLLLLASGCSQLATTGNSAQPATAEKQEQITVNEESVPVYLHQVQRRGETLILISQWYTGSGSNWRAIVRANPDLDPRRIQVGDRIRIPEDLLQTRNIMPADFRLRDKPVHPEPPETGPQEKTTDALDLFGPVDSDNQEERKEEETRMILESLDE